MTGLAGVDPATVVPGDVAGLRDLAGTYRTRSGVYDDADVAVRDLDLSEWFGPASRSAEARTGEIRANLQAAADAYLAAAGALEQYAYALEAAQAKASGAVTSWQAAQTQLAAIGRPGPQLSLVEYHEATGPWVDQQTWAVDDVSEARSAVSTAAATAAAVLRDAARYAPVPWDGSILDLLMSTPDRDDYTSDDQWAAVFATWARGLPDDESGRQALREAVSRLSTAELNRLLELRSYCTATATYESGADFLEPLLVRCDLSADPVYGDLYDAVQQFPDPAHHTYDPNDARDTRTAAAAVAAAWAALTPERRLAATRLYPWLVGAADGVDTVHRDMANRQVLAIDTAVTNTDLRRVEEKIAAQPKINRDTLELVEERAGLTARRDFLNEVRDLIEPSVPGKASAAVDKYLVVLDPTVDGTGSNYQTGRAAIAWGNPDKATNVGIVVPGMTTFASDVDGGRLHGLVRDAGNLYSTTEPLLDPGGSVSTVAWIGYGAPGNPLSASSSGDLSVVTDKKAHEGAFSLGAFEWGLEEAHLAETGKSPNMTTLAHSYGSVVAGATIHHDNPSDNLVVFGSPGITVDHVSELDISQLNVYKALAESDWDLVGEIGILEPFGNQVATNLPIGDEWGGIRIRTKGASAHSDYMNLGTESLTNFSKVVAGKGGEVSKHPTQPEYLAPAAEPYDLLSTPREF